MVKQVRLLSIFFYVQGGLEILVSLYYFFLAAFFPTMMVANQRKGFNQAGPSEETMIWIMIGAFVGIGLLILIAGVLRIFAAYRSYKFTGRGLAIASLVVGAATCMTCYCAPTSIALLVYGLIVYCNPEVTAAFAMRKQGHSPDQILAAFNPYQQPTYQAPKTPPQ